MSQTLIRRNSPWICLMLFCCLILPGCATTSEGLSNQIGGTLGGAALGALLGGLIGGDAQSALIGAAAGGAMGWTVATAAQYEADQIRTAQEDRRMFGYKRGVNCPTVKIRQAMVSPDRARPGQEIMVVTDYSLILPKGTSQASVQETYVVMKDGKEVYRLPPQTRSRSEGGFSGKRAVNIPRNCKSGTYVVEHRTISGSSHDITTTAFLIE